MNIIPEAELNDFREKELQRRIERLKHAKKQQLEQYRTNTDNLHIVYVMRQVEPYGGTKIILQHANKLTENGVKVTLVSHFPKPNWYPIHSEYISIALDREVAEGIPNCDVIVATSWNHINACIETKKAPVVFFEQGGSHLFGWDTLEQDKRIILKKVLTLPRFVYTVSNNAAKLLKQIYQIESVDVFHNALDENIFYSTDARQDLTSPYMLMVGSDKDEFKCIPDIIEAFKIINEQGYDLELSWISKDEPRNRHGNVYVRPPQETIGDLYRGAKIFVSGSRYESFSLPVLEAMACGCPVVTTVNAGVLEYARDNVNCLFAQVNNPLSLARQVIRLLNDEQLYLSLRNSGIKTAEQFKWDNIIPGLIEYYRHIANFRVV